MPDDLAYASNPSTWETKVRGQGVWVSLRYMLRKTYRLCSVHDIEVPLSKNDRNKVLRLEQTDLLLQNFYHEVWKLSAP